MTEFNGAMDDADEAVVFYSSHALELKRLPPLPVAAVTEGFGRKDLFVFNQRKQLEEWLFSHGYENSVLLLMSSGNYDGMDIQGLAHTITPGAV
jgi:UDP-N-acetylmuramate: L-alanyl-gamma-D-glutamyl-meso-diaminopimelate ligase